MTSVMVPTPFYLLVILVMMIGIGFPIGILLRRKVLDYLALLLLVTTIICGALDLFLYNQLFTWCYSLENMGPISVGCSNFLGQIYATIPIGILGTLVVIVMITKKWLLAKSKI